MSHLPTLSFMLFLNNPFQPEKAFTFKGSINMRFFFLLAFIMVFILVYIVRWWLKCNFAFQDINFGVYIYIVRWWSKGNFYPQMCASCSPHHVLHNPCLAQWITSSMIMFLILKDKKTSSWYFLFYWFVCHLKLFFWCVMLPQTRFPFTQNRKIYLCICGSSPL